MRFCSSIKPMALCFVLGFGGVAERAQAGPLIDWLFGRRAEAPAYPVGQPVPLGNGYAAGYGVYPNQPGYAASYGNYYGNQLPVVGAGGAGYAAVPNGGITAATLPRTMSYVPNYRTYSNRTPVTYYRPLLTTDPSTGAQVVTMAPCTSYEYQAGRAPALGRSALYPPNLVPQTQPAPRALPTYTLPSGGIPLAGNSPVYTTPQVSAYGSYANPYPGTSAYGSYSSGYSGYATSPMQSHPAYSVPYSGGAVSGGCSGSYAPPAAGPVPGLSAPPAGTTITPSDTYGLPTTPPGASSSDPNSLGPAPNPGSGVFPPPDTSGDSAPTLPQGFNSSSYQRRPALRGVQQTPMEQTDSHFTTNDSRSSESHFPKVKVPSIHAPGDSMEQREASEIPSMAPIPVPKDFDVERRWNPGLLREEDMTALRPIENNAARFAGQSKKIHWASFEESPRVSQSSATSLGDSNSLRPIEPPANHINGAPQETVSRPYRSQRPAPSTGPTSTTAPSKKYESRGWKVSR